MTANDKPLDEIPTATCELPEIATWNGLKFTRGNNDPPAPLLTGPRIIAFRLRKFVCSRSLKPSRIAAADRNKCGRLIRRTYIEEISASKLFTNRTLCLCPVRGPLDLLSSY